MNKEQWVLQGRKEYAYSLIFYLDIDDSMQCEMIYDKRYHSLTYNELEEEDFTITEELFL